MFRTERRNLRCVSALFERALCFHEGLLICGSFCSLWKNEIAVIGSKSPSTTLQTNLYVLRSGFRMGRFVPLIIFTSDELEVPVLKSLFELQTGDLFGGTAYENIL